MNNNGNRADPQSLLQREELVSVSVHIIWSACGSKMYRSSRWPSNALVLSYKQLCVNKACVDAEGRGFYSPFVWGSAVGSILCPQIQPKFYLISSFACFLLSRACSLLLMTFFSHQVFYCPHLMLPYVCSLPAKRRYSGCGTRPCCNSKTNS